MKKMISYLLFSLTLVSTSYAMESSKLTDSMDCYERCNTRKRECDNRCFNSPKVGNAYNQCRFSCDKAIDQCWNGCKSDSLDEDVALWKSSNSVLLTGGVSSEGKYFGCGARAACRAALNYRIQSIQEDLRTRCISNNGKISAHTYESRERIYNNGKEWSYYQPYGATCSHFVEP